jgi:hypothetical protein
MSDEDEDEVVVGKLIDGRIDRAPLVGPARRRLVCRPRRHALACVFLIIRLIARLDEMPLIVCRLESRTTRPFQRGILCRLVVDRRVPGIKPEEWGRQTQDLTALTSVTEEKKKAVSFAQGTKLTESTCIDRSASLSSSESIIKSSSSSDTSLSKVGSSSSAAPC